MEAGLTLGALLLVDYSLAITEGDGASPAIVGASPTSRAAGLINIDHSTLLSGKVTCLVHDSFVLLQILDSFGSLVQQSLESLDWSLGFGQLLLGGLAGRS